jgi:hypothetical protein
MILKIRKRSVKHSPNETMADSARFKRSVNKQPLFPTANKKDSSSLA